MFEVLRYQTEDGRQPFTEWLKSILDKATPAGNLARMIDSLGRVTDMACDSRWNKVTSLTRCQDNGAPVTTTNVCDARTDNLVSSTDFESNTSTFAYDSRSQVTAITDDEGDRPLLTIYAEGSSISRPYGAVGRLARHTRTGNRSK